LLGSSAQFDKKDDRDSAFSRLQKIMEIVNNNEGLHLVEHLLLRPKLDEVLDENNTEETVSFLNICLDSCDLNSVQDEEIGLPPYKKEVSRTTAAKCYDNMPWVLQYIRLTPGTGVYEKSVLFQSVPTDGTAPVLLKFRQYEDMVLRVNDLNEFGSERGNYEIVSDGQTPAHYGYVIHGNDGIALAQSIYIFNKNIDPGVAAKDPYDINREIGNLVQYFGYLLELYCKASPCGGNADPYSFKATAVLPCWPKRLRDPSFRNLVEKTIISESPAHIRTKVVWIGIEEMQRFEKVYNAWLTEMYQTEVPDYAVVNPLIDVLNTLVPCGVCADECNGDGTPTHAPGPAPNPVPSPAPSPPQG
jgi:hypothetical protein